MQAEKDLPGSAKIPSQITIIFDVLEKYLNILANSLASTGKPFSADLYCCVFNCK